MLCEISSSPEQQEGDRERRGSWFIGWGNRHQHKRSLQLLRTQPYPPPPTCFETRHQTHPLTLTIHALLCPDTTPYSSPAPLHSSILSLVERALLLYMRRPLPPSAPRQVTPLGEPLPQLRFGLCPVGARALTCPSPRPSSLTCTCHVAANTLAARCAVARTLLPTARRSLAAARSSVRAFAFAASVTRSPANAVADFAFLTH